MKERKLLLKENLERILIFLSVIPPLIAIHSILSPYFYFLSLFLILSALLLDHKNYFLPRWFINLAGVAFIILFFLTVDLANFLERSLQTLLLLLSLKLLEKKETKRCLSNLSFRNASFSRSKLLPYCSLVFYPSFLSAFLYRLCPLFAPLSGGR